ncbi:MAG TPA: hypothetical protein VJZ71_03740 [Phycisphaerae bacterium]|nr:hypothetical protein [Phycisphaerae bacterium]
MKYLLGMFTIAAILFASSGCSLVVGKAAVWGGKKVYQKIKDNKADNEQVVVHDAHEDEGR